MCGRYASSRRPEDLVEEFEISDSRVSAPLEPDYNVAPTKEVYAVVERAPQARRRGAAGRAARTRSRQLRVLRWGLIPSWAKDPDDRQPDDQRPDGDGGREAGLPPGLLQPRAACCRPTATSSGIPPSQKTKAGKPLKQPFFITPKDGGVLAMAGLYEIWRDPTRDDDDPDRFRWTCTVLTTAGRGRRRPHPRPDAADGRPGALGRLARPAPRPKVPTEDLLALLTPAAPGQLDAFPVATLVNNVRNNGPELLDPLPLDELPDGVDGG